VRLTRRLVLLVAIASLLAWAPVAGAGPSGAIFTTDVTGMFVNGNVYDAKEDVYLNGGPRPNAPCTAAGLPDGVYVFQVTDPSGHALLSEDDADQRLVSVRGGVIVQEDPNISAHPLLPGQCGGYTVQLVPFADTENPGGEYKVWMTLFSDYEMFGFTPSQSKTDNFKVVAPEPPGD
jgi:hypothetical protein